MKRLSVLVTIACALLATSNALAQQSANYELSEFMLNAGGNPLNGSPLVSASFSIRLDAIGQSVSNGISSSPSWSLDGGLLAALAPPGEVNGTRFTTKTTLVWNSEPRASHYNLYRGSLLQVRSLDYGSCLQFPITGTIAADTANPGAASGFAYLVTASNRIREQGTLGTSDSGVVRHASVPCP